MARSSYLIYTYGRHRIACFSAASSHYWTQLRIKLHIIPEGPDLYHCLTPNTDGLILVQDCKFNFNFSLFSAADLFHLSKLIGWKMSSDRKTDSNPKLNTMLRTDAFFWEEFIMGWWVFLMWEAFFATDTLNSFCRFWEINNVNSIPPRHTEK